MYVSEALAQFVAMRPQVDSIGGIFDALEQELTRRGYRLPESSIYDSLQTSRSCEGARRVYGRVVGIWRPDGADKGEAPRQGTSINIGF